MLWYSKKVLLVDLMPKDHTINAEMYCNILKKLRRNIHFYLFTRFRTSRLSFVYLIERISGWET